jgi:hypothetical protein
MYNAIAKRGYGFSMKYAGTIFAIGIADGHFRTGSPHYGQHWHGRNYCDYKDVCILPNPLEFEEFKDVINIQQRTITPLTAAKFEYLVSRITETNPSVSFLSRKIHRDVDLNVLSKSTGWRGVAKSGPLPFIFEDQVREYLLDGFIKELAGRRGRISVEAHSKHMQHGEGFMDYVISIEEKHIPFEAKLQVIPDSVLVSQLEKYCSARVSIGGRSVIATDFCFVADSDNLWIYRKSLPSQDTGSVVPVASFRDLSQINDLFSHTQLKEIFHG